HFTYVNAPVITGLDTTSGPIGGGTSVTITGTDLGLATGVTVGGAPATGLSANTDTSVTITTPAGSAGPADVIVTTPYGDSGVSGAGAFTYVNAPVITGLDTTSGPIGGGTSVTITGT